jgi:predicted transcriptional regulator
MPTAKKQALEMVEKLPEKAKGDDIMYKIYVRKKIDAGVTAANAGRVIPHIEVKKRLIKK